MILLILLLLIAFACMSSRSANRRTARATAIAAAEAHRTGIATRAIANHRSFRDQEATEQWRAVKAWFWKNLFCWAFAIGFVIWIRYR